MDEDMTDDRSLNSLTLSGQQLRAINAYLRSNPHELFQISYVRSLVAADRLRETDPTDIRTFAKAGPAVIENAILHNLEGLKNLWALDRPSRLIGPLRSSTFFQTFKKQLSVLTVGPRTEAEILTLIAAGFDPANIRGLDLISYSDMVDLGDMHDMPYGDDTFDVVILGWVLGYSKDNPRVAAEVLRVARPGAYIAIGCEHNPLSNEEINEHTAISLADATRFDHTDQILGLFEGHIHAVLFRHDVHPDMEGRSSDLMVIFLLRA